jgi:hypothetical protein
MLGWLFGKKRTYNREIVEKIIKGTDMLKVDLTDISDTMETLADGIAAGYMAHCKDVALPTSKIAINENYNLMLIIPPHELAVANVFIDVDDSGWEWLDLNLNNVKVVS